MHTPLQLHTTSHSSHSSQLNTHSDGTTAPLLIWLSRQDAWVHFASAWRHSWNVFVAGPGNRRVPDPGSCCAGQPASLAGRSTLHSTARSDKHTARTAATNTCTRSQHATPPAHSNTVLLIESWPNSIVEAIHAALARPFACSRAVMAWWYSSHHHVVGVGP
jgi:hypothetical protein